jgi:CelD/BcsL family acetyltransferase involved in cellulose biosynthesis
MQVRKMLRIRIVESSDEFSNLREEWNKLLNVSEENTIFLTWEWLYTWWEKYSSNDKLHIVLFYDYNDKFVGIAPFCVSSIRMLGIRLRILKLLGAEVVCSEYLDIITDSEKTPEVVEALAKYLQENRSKFDILHFKDVQQDSILNKAIKRLNRNIFFIQAETKKTTNPFIPLPSDESILVKRLKGNKRSSSQFADIVRREKKLKRGHKVWFQRIGEEEDLYDAFETFINLHQKLWRSRGEKGSFWRKHFVDFHRSVAMRFFQRKWLCLYFLIVDEMPIAALYGFRYGNKFYYYQSGFDPDWKTYGVGKILLMHTIREAILQDLHEYDFLRGNAEYKYDFTDTFRHTSEVIAAMNSHKAFFFIAAKECKKIIKNALKLVLPVVIIDKLKRVRDLVFVG